MQGHAISDIFARYPDLYPSSVVGITRAGEAAGFLPDAFDEIARQAETSHSFRRWFFWVWFLTINFALSIPLAQVTAVGMKSDWDKLNATGGNAGGNGMGFFFGEMLHALIWPWGPITLAAYGAFLILNRWMASAASENFRHQLGLKIPVYGKRAWQENLARFSWTMARVSRSGISPARAWELSAESVPNSAFRNELLAIGGQLKGSEKMSDLFFRSKLFPDEYAPMIASAEYTGDLPGALDRLSQISAGEFVAAQNYAKARSGCWGLLGCFITSALTIGIVYGAYLGIASDILKEINGGN
jgi:type II secretory pathway component PulF